MIVATAVAAASVIAGTVYAAIQTSPNTVGTAVESLDIIHHNPDELVAASDIIVVATYESVTTATVVDAGSRGISDIAETNRHEEKIRTFRADEVLRGAGVKPGAKFEGHWTTSIWFPASEVGTTKPVASSLDDLDLTPGRQYVVFLAALADQDGRAYLGSYGTSSIASLKADELTFLTSPAYVEQLEKAGLHGGLPGSFRGMTLSALRGRVSMDDARRSSAAGQPTPGLLLSPREVAVQQLLDALPALSTPSDIESRATALGLTGTQLGDAAFCAKLEGVVLTTRGIQVDLGCDSP